MISGGALGAFLAVMGFHASFVVPITRQGPSCASTGPSLAHNTPVLCKVWAGSDTLGGFAHGWYEFGARFPGDTVRAICASPPGPLFAGVTTSLDGVHWSCWTLGAVSPYDIVVPGDLNGDGFVDLRDVGILAGAIQSPATVVFPK